MKTRTVSALLSTVCLSLLVFTTNAYPLGAVATQASDLRSRYRLASPGTRSGIDLGKPPNRQRSSVRSRDLPRQRGLNGQPGPG